MTKFSFLPDTRNFLKICNYKTDLLFIKKWLIFFFMIGVLFRDDKVSIWTLFSWRAGRGGKVLSGRSDVPRGFEDGCRAWLTSSPTATVSSLAILSISKKRGLSEAIYSSGTHQHLFSHLTYNLNDFTTSTCHENGCGHI